MTSAEVFHIYCSTLPFLWFYLAGELRHSYRTWSAWLIFLTALTLVWPLVLLAMLFERVGKEVEEE